MLAALLLVAAATTPPPLAVWPTEMGPAMTVVDEVEFYVTEPEAAYSLIAFQALPRPLVRGDMAALKRLAALARKLGAEAVVLLGEMPESAIPEDVEQPLPSTGATTVVAFVVFEACDQCPEDGTRSASLSPAPSRVEGCSGQSVTGRLKLTQGGGGHAGLRLRLTAMPPPPRAMKMSAWTTVRYCTGVAFAPIARNTRPRSTMPA